MPNALAIGISESEFWGMTPHRLKIHAEAYRIKMKSLDRQIWSVCGNYVLSAVAVAVEHCLFRNKAKSKYIENPILSKTDNDKELTEEEIKAQRELFVSKLLVMQTNFELSKEKGNA